MVITTVHGSNSVNLPDWKVQMVDAKNFGEYEFEVRKFLDDQPTSLAPLHTTDSMCDLMKYGAHTGWLLLDENDEGIGLAIFSIFRCADNILVANIEFVSCRQIFKMAQMMPYFIQACRNNGVSYIEATTHPVLAEYLVKRYDFGAPSVYVRKCIAPQRSN